MSIFELHDECPQLYNCKIIDCSNSTIEDAGTSTLDLSPEVLQLLRSNSRDSYKKFAIKIKNKENITDWRKLCKNRIITLKNALITSNGIIINPQGIWKMGGCVANEQINTNQAMQYYNNIVKTQQRFKKVVSIAALWASGVWHFPMEALVALNLISDFKDTNLHISQKSKLCLDWIKLIDIEISPDKILDKTVYAEELILPEMGKCGNPYYNQVLWLKEKVHYSIPNNSSQNLFILIKRNKKRQVKNHEIIETICKNFCAKRNLQFYLHDDLFLPSLKEQLVIFNKAAVIIGPHGAGSVNLIATKNKVCFIEFINNADINICYMRLSNLLNIEYFGIGYDLLEGVNITRDLIPTLNKIDDF